MTTPPSEYWRSIEDLENDPSLVQARHDEFPPMPANMVAVAALNRRKFLGITGATAALALSGCIRKPKEHILPYSKRPEDLIPGKPRYFATSAQIGGTVLGLLVESQDNRPTKIEGNPKHPMSLGSTNAWAQAEILSLYDTERAREPLHDNKKSSWEDFDRFITEHLAAQDSHGGRGLAVLMQHRSSPTLRGMLTRLRQRFPNAAFHQHEPLDVGNARAALRSMGLHQTIASFDFEQADIIVSLDADPIGTEGDVVRNGRFFAARRVLESPKDSMNRLYVVEPYMSITGANADHRLRLKSSEVGAFTAALAGELDRLGVGFPEGAGTLRQRLSGKAKGRFGVWVSAVAADLAKHAGRSLVIVGERQPAWVHQLGLLINQALGNVGQTIRFTEEEDPPVAGNLFELVQAMRQGAIHTLMIFGANPAYDAPADLDFAAAMDKVAVRIRHGLAVDETSRRCTWHLPASHFLEAWGDTRASTGATSIQQPLIAPLFSTRSELEVLGRMLGDPQSGYELVRAHWRHRLNLEPSFDRTWRRWLHDGIIEEAVGKTREPVPDYGAMLAAHPAKDPEEAAAAEGLEISFHADTSVVDGRYANNPWLQELPEPTTKLTWDNAALMSAATAQQLSIANGDMVELAFDGRTLRAATFVAPGTAEGTIVLHLGYGRTMGGRYAQGAGFNAYALRTSGAPYFGTGLSVRKLGGTYPLASTQDHGSMEGRAIVREATLADFVADPGFAHKMVEHPPIRSMWQPPLFEGPHQWGMTIDLNKCIGCNACTVACQAENNIPTVGKEQVLRGREMHWIRIDRYFNGPVDDPQMVSQPMACQHCETAPCEAVCPVNATAHSPEGLNDMAYNRCIGTRYCSNNCPYKVRRFNFFNYNLDADPVEQMQKNPDVTVRFRGVMEKCTYCVQRIQQAKIDAKVGGNGRVPDGGVVPACAQACPTEAIVFGDIADASSEVSRQKRNPRSYGVLAEINTQPRTSYLAKVRNPNPDLVKS